MTYKLTAFAPLALAALINTASAQSLDMLSVPIHDSSKLSNEPGRISQVSLTDSKTGKSTQTPATSIRDCFEKVRNASQTLQSNVTGFCSNPYKIIVAAFTCKIDPSKKNGPRCSADAV